MQIKNYVKSICCIGICCGCYWLGYTSGKGNGRNNKQIDNSISPVESIVIDTLYITRDNIKYKIKYLDSIKHDTIEKTYNLDDSNSIKLFYQLCTE